MFPLAIAKARLFTVEVNRLSKWKDASIPAAIFLSVFEASVSFIPRFFHVEGFIPLDDKASSEAVRRHDTKYVVTTIRSDSMFPGNVTVLAFGSIIHR